VDASSVRKEGLSWNEEKRGRDRGAALVTCVFDFPPPLVVFVFRFPASRPVTHSLKLVFLPRSFPPLIFPLCVRLFCPRKVSCGGKGREASDREEKRKEDF